MMDLARTCRPGPEDSEDVLGVAYLAAAEGQNPIAAAGAWARRERRIRSRTVPIDSVPELAAPVEVVPAEEREVLALALSWARALPSGATDLKPLLLAVACRVEVGGAVTQASLAADLCCDQSTVCRQLARLRPVIRALITEV